MSVLNRVFTETVLDWLLERHPALRSMPEADLWHEIDLADMVARRRWGLHPGQPVPEKMRHRWLLQLAIELHLRQQRLEDATTGGAER